MFWHMLTNVVKPMAEQREWMNKLSRISSGMAWTDGWTNGRKS